MNQWLSKTIPDLFLILLQDIYELEISQKAKNGRIQPKVDDFCQLIIEFRRLTDYWFV